jgi:hypothetical protein
MTSNVIPLDPTIAALADFSASLGPMPVVHVIRLYTGEFVFAPDSRFILGAATMFTLAMAMVVANHAAQPTEASTRGVRHMAYREGAVKPPKRKSAADRRAAEVRAWGFTKRVHPDQEILQVLTSNPLVSSIQIVGVRS